MRDTIYRQSAINTLVDQTIYTYDEILRECEKVKNANSWLGGIKDALDVINELPPALLLDDCIKNDLKKCITEIKDTGKYHGHQIQGDCDSTILGLEIALHIVEESEIRNCIINVKPAQPKANSSN